MATKTIQGIGGNCSLPSGFNAKLNTFTFDIDLTTVDTTGFIDAGWRVHAPTLMDFSGTTVGTLQYDGATTAPMPSLMMGATPDTTLASGTITLTFAVGCTWTFVGTINKVSGSRPVDGKADITYSFQHAGGGVAQVWDETP